MGGGGTKSLRLLQKQNKRLEIVDCASSTSSEANTGVERRLPIDDYS